MRTSVTKYLVNLFLEFHRLTYLEHITWNCMYDLEGIDGYYGGLTLNELPEKPAPNCIKDSLIYRVILADRVRLYNWSKWWLWTIMFDVIIVSNGNNCNVKLIDQNNPINLWNYFIQSGTGSVTVDCDSYVKSENPDEPPCWINRRSI